MNFFWDYIPVFIKKIIYENILNQIFLICEVIEENYLIFDIYIFFFIHSFSEAHRKCLFLMRLS